MAPAAPCPPRSRRWLPGPGRPRRSRTRTGLRWWRAPGTSSRRRCSRAGTWESDPGTGRCTTTPAGGRPDPVLGSVSLAASFSVLFEDLAEHPGGQAAASGRGDGKVLDGAVDVAGVQQQGAQVVVGVQVATLDAGPVG